MLTESLPSAGSTVGTVMETGVTPPMVRKSTGPMTSSCHMTGFCPRRSSGTRTAKPFDIVCEMPTSPKPLSTNPAAANSRSISGRSAARALSIAS